MQQNESKGINANDFLLSYHFVDSDFDYVEPRSDDENDIKVLRDNIYWLTNACNDQEKLFQICDYKEAKLKDDIISLKVKLEELERVEEGMRK